MSANIFMESKNKENSWLLMIIYQYTIAKNRPQLRAILLIIKKTLDLFELIL